MISGKRPKVGDIVVVSTDHGERYRGRVTELLSTQFVYAFPAPGGREIVSKIAFFTDDWEVEDDG